MGDNVQNLWQISFDQLPDELQRSLNSARTARLDVLDAVLEAAKNKRQDSLNKRWRITTSSGKEIIIRDVLDKVVEWINRFKHVGDTLIQYDPGHLALPWAAIKFLLQAAVNDKHAFGEMVIDLEYITRLIARYRLFESLHQHEGSLTKDQIESTLIALYSEILKYLAIVIKYLQTSPLRKAVKSPFNDPDATRMKGIIAKQDEISQLSELASFEKLQGMKETITRLADYASHTTREMDKEKRSKILNWVSSINYLKHHKHHQRERTPETGQWLLDHAKYREWQFASCSSILQIHGIPGCGKTKLCTRVIDDLLQAPQAAVAYFYCDVFEAEPARQNPEEVLRSLVRQLSINRSHQQSLREEIQLEYNRQLARADAEGFELDALQSDDCTRLILEVAEKDPINIVIDAVDVVENFQIILKCLSRIVERAGNVVKVLLFSRSDVGVERYLPGMERIHLDQDYIQKDMQLFIGSRMEKMIADKNFLHGHDAAHWRPKISQALIENAGNLFLLLELQLQQIQLMMAAPDMIKLIRNTRPQTLDDQYSHAMRQIQDSGATSSTVATLAFSFLLVLQVPLVPAAFLELVSRASLLDNVMAMSQSTLVQISQNLLLLDTQSDCFRFRHQTVRDFLLDSEQYTLLQCEKRLAEACLKLCLDGPPDGMPSIEMVRQDSSAYAALYWAHHCSLAQNDADEHHLLPRLTEFAVIDYEPSHYFLCWIKFMENLEPTLPRSHPQKTNVAALSSQKPTLLFVASIYGLDSLLWFMELSLTFDWHQLNSQEHSSIYLAAANGQDAIVKRLLAHNVDIHIQCGKHGNALYAACFNGHMKTVEILLQNGANIDAPGPHSNAYDAAFHGCHENIAIFLANHQLKAGNTKVSTSVLENASEMGFIGFVDLFDNRNTSPGLADENKLKLKSITSLIRSGSVKLLRRILDGTHDPKSQLPEDGVSIAVSRGKLEMTEFLIQHGLPIEKEGPLGSPLRVASLLGYEMIVRFLIAKGAQLQTSSSFGDALHAAAMKGHCAIVRLLISYNVSVNHQSGYFGNALQAAAYSGHIEIVRILLDAGAAIVNPGLFGDAACAAASAGQEDILFVFLQQGYLPQSTPDFSGFTSRALISSGERVIRNLYHPHDLDSHLKRHHHCSDAAPWSEMELKDVDLYKISNLELRTNSENVCPGSKICAGWCLFRYGRPCGKQWQNNVIAHCSTSRFLDLIRKNPECFKLTKNDSYGFLMSSVAKNSIQSVSYYLKTFPFCRDSVNKAVELALSLDHPDALIILLQRAIKVDDIDDAIFRKGLSYISRASLMFSKEMFKILRTVPTSRSDGKLLDDALIAAACGKSIDVFDMIYDGISDWSEVTTASALKSACTAGTPLALHILNRCYPHNELTTDIMVEATFSAASHGHSELLSQLMVMKFVRWDRRRIEDRIRSVVKGLSAVGLTLLKTQYEPLESWPNLLRETLAEAVKDGNLPYVTVLLQELAAPLRNSNATAFESLSKVDILQLLRDSLIWRRYLRPIYEQEGLGDSRKQRIRRMRENFESIFCLLIDTFSLLILDEEDVRDLVNEALNDVSFACARLLILHCSRSDIDLSLRTKSLDLGLTLETAVQQKDIELLDALITFGIAIDDPMPHYGSTVHAAALMGHTDILRRLFKASARSNVENGDSVSPVRAAVEGNRPEVVELLLEQSPDTETYWDVSSLRLHWFRELRNPNPLKAAISRGNSKISLALLRAGTWPNIRHMEVDGLNIMIAACELGSVAIMEHMVRLGADTTALGSKQKCFPDYPQYQSALHMACYYGHSDIVDVFLKDETLIDRLEELLQEFFQENSTSIKLKTPLGLASSRGHIKVVRRLMLAGADPNVEFHHEFNWPVNSLNIDSNQRSFSALIVAASNGHAIVVEELLLHGCVGVQLALQVAAHRGHQDVVALLIDQFVGERNADEIIDEALLIASQQQHAGVVELLLKCKRLAVTDLMHVCRVGNASMVLRLLDQIALTDTESPNIEGCLVVAAEALQPSVVDILLRTSLDLSVCGGAPLIAAFKAVKDYSANDLSRFKHFMSYPRILSLEKIVRTLLLKGANPNTTMNGGSVLHLACLVGNLPCVEMLLDYGANINCHDTSQRSPLNVASQEGHTHVVSYLDKRGAVL